MEWLNYHHLFYFWTVVREGSIAAASRQLMLTQSTISMQLRSLEKSLGETLLVRSGRRLVPTEAGRLAFRYADEIFSIGKELHDAFHNQAGERPLKLVVGVTDVLSKLIAYRLLEPIFKIRQPIRIVCREGKVDVLLADLAVHQLDIVLADAAFDPTIRVRAYNHLLGECGVSIFGVPVLARKYRRGFPLSLDGAPFLLPTDNTSLRQSLGRWFEAEGIRPSILGEFEDSALIKVFGQAGHGLFAAPTIIESDVQRQHQVRLVGRIDAARTRFYAVSVERRVTHPAVRAITDAAKEKLFEQSK